MALLWKQLQHLHAKPTLPRSAPVSRHKIAPLPTPHRHVLFDVLAPLFNLQHLFGLYTPAAQLLVLGPQNGSDAELQHELRKYINTPDPALSLLRLTWDADAAWLGEYVRRVLGEEAARQRGGGLVCFKASKVGVLSVRCAGDVCGGVLAVRLMQSSACYCTGGSSQQRHCMRQQDKPVTAARQPT